jgi:transposase
MATTATENGKRASLPLRRDYTLAFKLQVLNETLVPGASVSIVARRHDINTNVVFRWRKLFREGRLGNGASEQKKLPPPEFAPVRMVPDASAVPALPPPKLRPVAKPEPRKKSAVMAITLPGGFALRVEEGIDEAALRRLLRAVRELA